MWRIVLLTMAWVAAAAFLYAALVVLEIHWNLYEWEPKLDLAALALLTCLCAALLALGLLARADSSCLGRVLPLVLCLALVALAFYLLPPESVGQGLFGRQHPSPGWYRAVRFAVLLLPIVFWGSGQLRSVRKSNPR